MKVREGSGGFAWVLWDWEQWREERTGKDKEGEEGFIGFSCGRETLGASLWLLGLLWIFFVLEAASSWRLSKRTKIQQLMLNVQFLYFSTMSNW
jgi:hypothetical protein